MALGRRESHDQTPEAALAMCAGALGRGKPGGALPTVLSSGVLMGGRAALLRDDGVDSRESEIKSD